LKFKGEKELWNINYAIVLKERGSTGTKGIAQRCGVIDSGYRGEWFVPITNTTNNTICITKDEKLMSVRNGINYPYSKAICQAVILPVPKMNVQEISLDQ
jgi:dUTP pyrophosphatase